MHFHQSITRSLNIAMSPRVIWHDRKSKHDQYGCLRHAKSALCLSARWDSYTIIVLSCERLIQEFLTLPGSDAGSFTTPLRQVEVSLVLTVDVSPWSSLLDRNDVKMVAWRQEKADKRHRRIRDTAFQGGNWTKKDETVRKENDTAAVPLSELLRLNPISGLHSSWECDWIVVLFWSEIVMLWDLGAWDSVLWGGAILFITPMRIAVDEMRIVIIWSCSVHKQHVRKDTEIWRLEFLVKQGKHCDKWETPLIHINPAVLHVIICTMGCIQSQRLIFTNVSIFMWGTFLVWDRLPCNYNLIKSRDRKCQLSKRITFFILKIPILVLQSSLSHVYLNAFTPVEHLDCSQSNKQETGPCEWFSKTATHI